MGQNDYRLEAYRIISDNLNRVRAVLRDALQQLHGAAWEGLVEPMDRRTYLGQRRDREVSINWRRATADDLLQYGNFSDLYEFVAADGRLIERFAALARDAEVLRLRFLEVDAIFNRVAYARSISDSEMELLVNFDERLRRLGDGATAGHLTVEVPVDSQPEPVAPPTLLPPTTPPSAQPSPAPPAGSGARAVPAGVQSAPVPAAADTAAGPAAAAPASAGASIPPAAISPSRLREALQAGDEGTVLAGLYGEVTSIADGLWSDTSCPSPRLWEVVRESSWYSDNFTSMGLKPLSDFYDLANTARGRLLDGSSRKQLQDFLKEHNFAQILLALRDLFRSRLPASPPN